LTTDPTAGSTRNPGGCLQPVLLRGRVDHLDGATGELLHRYTTVHEPGGVLPVACKTRRASQCPPCADVYRADTYQVIRTGLSGGKGIPETVASHPSVFTTLTAPSFGPVHVRREKDGRVLCCRPRRRGEFCPHGIRLSCPKGGRSRTVSLDRDTVAVLREHRCQQAEEGLATGSAWNDPGGLVFVTRWGEPLYPDTVTGLMAKLINRYNQSGPATPLPHARLHDLRHLHTTSLLAGVPVHVVAARLGHADPAVTLRVYSHVLREHASGVGDVFAQAVQGSC
jgi:Phage integrase family